MASATETMARFETPKDGSHEHLALSLRRTCHSGADATSVAAGELRLPGATYCLIVQVCAIWSSNSTSSLDFVSLSRVNTHQSLPASEPRTTVHTHSLTANSSIPILRSRPSYIIFNNPPRDRKSICIFLYAPRYAPSIDTWPYPLARPV